MDRRLGRPLPHQLPNPTRAHPVPPEFFAPYHAVLCAYAVLAAVSSCCPPVQGRLPTRYSPVRHSVFRNPPKSHPKSLVRLACVKHAASVHPEPGSNSLIECLMRFRITTWLFIPFLLFLKVSSLKIKLFKNFQGCFTVQLSRFFMLCADLHQLFDINTTFRICQEVFYFVFPKFLLCFDRTEKEGFEPSHRY